jgi:2,3-bisphosphoglycerate-dependent phosphoglycerate mutase
LEQNLKKLVLIRHGQSTWNKENRFTGWVDVDLSEQGVSEAESSAAKLKDLNISFDVIYTSVLLRAIRTAEIIKVNMNSNAPLIKHWKLNERHYGALAGLNKKETGQKYGEEQVHIWRRSFDTPPPQLDPPEILYGQSMTGESLKMTCERVIPYWTNVIAPDFQSGKSLLVAAHGNSLRALMKHLFNISDDEITSLEIPTGIPVICEFDDNYQAQKYTIQKD